MLSDAYRRPRLESSQSKREIVNSVNLKGVIRSDLYGFIANPVQRTASTARIKPTRGDTQNAARPDCPPRPLDAAKWALQLLPDVLHIIFFISSGQLDKKKKSANYRCSTSEICICNWTRIWTPPDTAVRSMTSEERNRRYHGETGGHLAVQAILHKALTNASIWMRSGNR